ncbi:hypothetical protein Bsel_0765 [[Bacillus] selenitireducens MLS10]|uniref:Uncharacterized protein n=1 Tax=Bacillus selenitireducens (strain ATCC 700615 / DSM 15326 / MLS10) TaxID=439292 RepID=D6XYY6_BACIE|nr:hypothetical protein Bsel_0765 [[Bacillus] selenitireducens MLS10]
MNIHKIIQCKKILEREMQYGLKFLLEDEISLSVILFN